MAAKEGGDDDIAAFYAVSFANFVPAPVHHTRRPCAAQRKLLCQHLFAAFFVTAEDGRIQADPAYSGHRGQRRNLRHRQIDHKRANHLEVIDDNAANRLHLRRERIHIAIELDNHAR